MPKATSPNRLSLLALAMAIAVGVIGCDDLLGTKSDPTTDEIFREGRIDPTLFEDVGYVPLTPFFTLGSNGPLQQPSDVYVGYDEFVYVLDESGLHVLDLAGRPVAFINADHPNAVVQDRRLHVYIAARRDTVIANRSFNLPVILRYSGISTGNPQLEDIIWHPFDDASRKFTRPDPISTDEEVSFTGVTALHDNRIYVSRKGPVNLRTTAALPQNAIMEFNPEGVNTQSITALSPTIPSLRSAINPSDVIGYFQPPQRSGLIFNDNFILAQTPPAGTKLRFAVLGIAAIESPDGIIFRPDIELIRSVANQESGDGFLFDEFKFDSPSDLAYAGDGTNYIFVLDAGKDSLFVFTGNGIEGVAPPAGADSPKPIVVSFGGTGDGPLQFNNPQGVAYADEVVYVADTGNNRILRFKLNTDFE